MDIFNSLPKIYIGFITYGKSTAKYLPYFLPSLKAQTYKNYKILAVDNTEIKDNDNSRFLKSHFPEIELLWAGENLGFGKAFNRMIRQAVNDGVEFFLALNPDMIFEPNFLEKIVAAVSQDRKIGAVAPKILRWDYESNKKTDKIDSLGLGVTKEHRFFDLHQGETDEAGLGLDEIFGFTGAAVLLNLKALAAVAYRPAGLPREYFDELMFMYKEDCDLSYRLRLAGWKIVFAPQAVAYHNRNVASIGQTNLQIALNRRNKNRLVKQWSFLNQWILLIKIKNLPFSRRVKLATIWYQLKSLVFVLLFEQYLLSELFKLWQLRHKIKDRRDQLVAVISIKELERIMD